MMVIAKPVLIALAVVLALSMLANAGLTWAYLGVRDERTEANGARDQARAAANACSRGVRELQSAAAEQKLEGTRFRTKADSDARSLEARAQQTLASPPAVAGDDCKSAAAAVDAWLQRRRTP